MSCSLDHSKLTGVKFCTECGALIEEAKRLCDQGHELVRKNKFCEICGSAEAGTASPSEPSAPIRSVPRPAPPVTPPPVTNTNLLPPPSNDFTAYTPPTKKNLAVIIGASVGALLLIIGLVINANKVTYTSVSVSMTIVDENCWDLSWGYGDIPGGQVVLNIDGAPSNYASYESFGSDSILGCKFTATFYEVPMNGEFYAVGLASGRRGTITKSLSEMESNGWSFDLSLG